MTLKVFVVSCRCSRRIKGGSVRLNLLYHSAINVWVDRVIKPRRFVCFISQHADMGNWHTHTYTHIHTHTQEKKLSVKGFSCSDCPEKALSCLSLSLHEFPQKSTSKLYLFIIMWKNTDWLKQQTRSIIATSYHGHVLASCRRYESFVSVFTVHPEAASWKTNIASTYCCLFSH